MKLYIESEYLPCSLRALLFSVDLELRISLLAITSKRSEIMMSMQKMSVRHSPLTQVGAVQRSMRDSKNIPSPLSSCDCPSVMMVWPMLDARRWFSVVLLSPKNDNRSGV